MSDLQRIQRSVERLGRIVHEQAEYIREMSARMQTMEGTVRNVLNCLSTNLDILRATQENSSVQTDILRGIGKDVIQVQEGVTHASQQSVRNVKHQVDVMRVLTTLQEVQKNMAELMLADTDEDEQEGMH